MSVASLTLQTVAICVILLNAKAYNRTGQIYALNGSSVALQCYANSTGNETKETSVIWNYIPFTKNSSTRNISVTSSEKRFFRGGSRDLILENVRFSDSGVYECQGKNGDLIFKTIVSIGEVPDTPKDVSCVTHHSLSRMECCWDVGRNTMLTTKYSLFSTLRIRSTIYGSEPIYISDEEECSYSITNDTQGLLPRQCCKMEDFAARNLDSNNIKEYVIYLKSENALGLKTTHDFIEKPFAWIKPSTPSNVTLDVYSIKSSYRLIAKWRKPNMSITEFEYGVRYRLNAGVWEDQRRIFDLEYDFEIMRSNSLLEFQVSAWPIGKYSGYWSDWSPSVFNSTGLLPPSSSMRYIKIESIISNEKMLINASWIPYARLRETGFYNWLTIRTCQGELVEEKNISALETRTTILTDVHNCVNISGWYCNRVGCSVASTRLLKHPTADSLGNISVYLRLTDQQYQVLWKTQNVSNTSICLIKIHAIWGSHSSQELDSQTIASKKLPCITGQYTLDTMVSPCYRYKAEVGIFHQTYDAIYIRAFGSQTIQANDPKVNSFGDFSLQTEQGPAPQLSVSWTNKNINCEQFVPRLLFVPTGGVERRKNSTEEFASEDLNCTSSSGNVTKNVYGGTKYKARLGMCCRPPDRQRITNGEVCFFPKSNTYRIFWTGITAPTRPVDFHWKDSNLLWSPPLHPNGPLEGYVIDISRKNSSTIEKSIRRSTSEIEGDELCDGFANNHISLKIRAYNVDGDRSILAGEAVTIQDIPCATRTLHHSSLSIIIVAVFCVLCVIVTTGVAYYYKQYIKNVIVRRLWPSLPRPRIIVTWRDQENCTVEANLLEQNERNLDEDESPTTPFSLSFQEQLDDINIPVPTNVTSQETALHETQIYPNSSQDTPTPSNNWSGYPSQLSQRSESLSSNEHNLTADDSGVISYSFLSTTTGPNKTAYLDSIKSQFSSSVVRGPGLNEDLHGQMSNNSPQRSTIFGSTPSLPSYLSCTNSPHCGMSGEIGPYSRFSSIAGFSENYQWSLPDYTFTSSSGIQTKYLWSGLASNPQSSPCDQILGRRNYTDYNFTLDDNLKSFNNEPLTFLIRMEGDEGGGDSQRNLNHFS